MTDEPDKVGKADKARLKSRDWAVGRKTKWKMIVGLIVGLNTKSRVMRLRK